jgi:hypothetical protein
VNHEGASRAGIICAFIFNAKNRKINPKAAVFPAFGVAIAAPNHLFICLIF